VLPSWELACTLYRSANRRSLKSYTPECAILRPGTTITRNNPSIAMQKDTWPVEKLALAVISGMIVGRGSESHTQTNNAVETRGRPIRTSDIGNILTPMPMLLKSVHILLSDCQAYCA